MATPKKIQVSKTIFELSPRAERILFSSLSVIVFLLILFFLHQIGKYYFWRFDLTEDNIFSLSETSKDIVGNLDDQLTIKAYFPEDLPQQVEDYQQFVSDLLLEYEDAGRGSLEYEIINPSDDESAQQEAQSYGITGQRFQVIENDKVSFRDNVFFGIAIIYGDQVELITNFDQQTLVSLDQVEYDLTSRIKNLSDPERTILGYLEADQIEPFGTRFSSVQAQLGELYTLQPVPAAEVANSGVDVLLVGGITQSLPAELLYQIDQAIVRGTNVLFLTDGVAVDTQQGLVNPLESGLAPLLEHYGVTTTPTGVFGPESLSFTFGGVLPSYLLSPGILENSDINKNIDTFLLPFGTPLNIREEALDENDELRVLYASNNDSWTQNNFTSGFSPQLATSTGAQPVMISFQGDLSSYYSAVSLPEGLDTAGVELISQIDNTRFIVVGGSSAFSSQILGNQIAQQNLNLLLNSIDWLSQDNSLLNIRSNVSAIEVLNLSDTEKDVIRWTNRILFPLVIGLIGFVYIFLRRQRMNRVY